MSEDGNGREVWRGKMEARLHSAEEDIALLFRWKDSHEHDESSFRVGVMQRLSILETKVAGFAAMGAAAGATIAIFVEWVLGGIGK